MAKKKLLLKNLKRYNGQLIFQITPSCAKCAVIVMLYTFTAQFGVLFKVSLNTTVLIRNFFIWLEVKRMKSNQMTTRKATFSIIDS